MTWPTCSDRNRDQKIPPNYAPPFAYAHHSHPTQSIKAGDFVVVACERPSHLHILGQAVGRCYNTLQQTLKARRLQVLAGQLWEPCVIDLQNGIAIVRVQATWKGLGGQRVMQGTRWLLPEETKFGR